MNRIILRGPRWKRESGLGFLPGTLQQKIDPYMRPLYDALYDMLERDKLDRFLEKESSKLRRWRSCGGAR